jgi:hypothetical protein
MVFSAAWCRFHELLISSFRKEIRISAVTISRKQLESQALHHQHHFDKYQLTPGHRHGLWLVRLEKKGNYAIAG